MAKITLRFLHGMAPYQAGETATFDAAYAQKVMRGGYAVPAEKDGGAKETAGGPGEQSSPGRALSWYSYPFFASLSAGGLRGEAQYGSTSPGGAHMPEVRGSAAEVSDKELERLHIFEVRRLAREAGIKHTVRTKKVELIARLRGGER